MARRKRYTKSARDGILFETDLGFLLYEIQHSSPWKEMAAFKAGMLAGKIIKTAPRGPHQVTDAYSIKQNIHANVKKTSAGWVGYVTIEENPQARHAMLQEKGWTDRAGHRHAGRFYIKAVLDAERAE
ncbi:MULTISPECIES: hypothetical protein [Streptomycetaceae]|uniref:Uncharacterized protein n=1 Tax=Streptantibioticus cattleyicolor (strain ATCC 35852 / DSM 46488 / JCM 4925 / NBRC 14057 / NRRL 8057) TaxID=1003195 RepID=F8JPY5_STREN|nr:MULTISPECIES: hypothetical protein [Streptomycetaceae]AEW94041.1 hypothetical protein SCATT_16700 [Streptantibioticus cattleyicolor NRRL 8057 = DSM 46488]MYS58715.1 hypothetical protein [Streptomyces sp. SID5468]CCB74394.1 protein of unknown function [Streptantibioticus cattleyicolor NRRL 8057 = DSM 46488]